jgi:hypothetical protein
MIDSRFFDAYRLSSSEMIPSPAQAAAVLCAHFIVGAALVFLGCHQKQVT